MTEPTTEEMLAVVYPFLAAQDPQGGWWTPEQMCERAYMFCRHRTASLPATVPMTHKVPMPQWTADAMERAQTLLLRHGYWFSFDPEIKDDKLRVICQIESMGMQFPVSGNDPLPRLAVLKAVYALAKEKDK